MFSLRDFIKNGLLKAVGHMADYQIILNAAGWHEKGVLQNSDLEEIHAAIEEYHTVVELPDEEIPPEETLAEETTEVE